MLRAEAANFVNDQMRTRWPEWKPSSQQLSDWAMWLGPYDYQNATNAVREHIGSQGRFNKRPNPTALRALLAKFQPRDEADKTALPEDTVFVLYAGGGIGTLQAGFFFPIIVKCGNIMRIAEQVRAARQARIGGEWRVYSDTADKDMVKLRREMRIELTKGTT